MLPRCEPVATAFRVLIKNFAREDDPLPRTFHRARPPIAAGRRETAQRRGQARPRSRSAACLPVVDFVRDACLRRGGVAAAMPSEADSIVQLDATLCHGRATYWICNLLALARRGSMSVPVYRTLRADASVALHAVASKDGLAAFVPGSDAYGHWKTGVDAYMDAGFSVLVKHRPYAHWHSPCDACAKEVAYLLMAATRGIAPCVLATFCVQHGDALDEDVQLVVSTGQCCSVPNQTAAPAQPQSVARIDTLVVVSQLCTFTLADLMQSPTARAVLPEALALTFTKLKQMCQLHLGYAMVKLNTTPESVVFCPSLKAAGDDEWVIEGIRYESQTLDTVDGLPMISNFHAALTSRVAASCHSLETSFVMHVLLLLAHAKACFGARVLRIAWDHLLAAGDPSGFVSAIDCIAADSKQATAFLDRVAESCDAAEHPGFHAAVVGTVADVRRLLLQGDTLRKYAASYGGRADAPPLQKAEAATPVFQEARFAVRASLPALCCPREASARRAVVCADGQDAHRIDGRGHGHLCAAFRGRRDQRTDRGGVHGGARASQGGAPRAPAGARGAVRREWQVRTEHGAVQHQNKAGTDMPEYQAKLGMGILDARPLPPFASPGAARDATNGSKYQLVYTLDSGLYQIRAMPGTTFDEAHYTAILDWTIARLRGWSWGLRVDDERHRFEVVDKSLHALPKSFDVVNYLDAEWNSVDRLPKHNFFLGFVKKR